MAPTSWKLPVLTGYQEMDDQHRTLIETFGRLRVLVNQGRSPDEQEALLVFFQEYLVGHLEFEQELMARHNYPGERPHRDRHGELALEIEIFVSEFQQGHQPLSQANLEYLDNWLHQHIQDEDVPFADFLTRLPPTQEGSL